MTDSKPQACDSAICRAVGRRCQNKGFLIIGHGTRNADGTAEFLQLAETLADRVAPLPVEASFLELQEPTIEMGWQRLLDRGAQHIFAMPLLLFAAGHARRDIPEALARCCVDMQPTDGRVCFSQSPPLECHEKMLLLSHRRLSEAIESESPIDWSRTALVMVGRGSLDDSATDEMRRFTNLRSGEYAAKVVRTGFVAMAEPKITTVLDEVGQAAGIDTVIVQPHLLFEGELNQRIRQMVADARERYSDRRWIVTDHLGPDVLVGEALLELANQVV